MISGSVLQQTDSALDTAEQIGDRLGAYHQLIVDGLWLSDGFHLLRVFARPQPPQATDARVEHRMQLADGGMGPTFAVTWHWQPAPKSAGALSRLAERYADPTVPHVRAIVDPDIAPEWPWNDEQEARRVRAADGSGTSDLFVRVAIQEALATCDVDRWTLTPVLTPPTDTARARLDAAARTGWRPHMLVGWSQGEVVALCMPLDLEAGKTTRAEWDEAENARKRVAHA